MNDQTPNPLHLTDAQVDDALIGADLAPLAAAHLATCSACADRVATAAAPIAAFRSVSLAWAQRHSATLPLRPTAAPTSVFHRLAYQRLAYRLAAGTALASLLVAGVTIPVLRHTHRADLAVTDQQQQPVMMASTGAVSSLSLQNQDEQIAHDNQLLQDIDSALASPEVTPASLGLQTTQPQHAAHATALQD